MFAFADGMGHGSASPTGAEWTWEHEILIMLVWYPCTCCLDALLAYGGSLGLRRHAFICLASLLPWNIVVSAIDLPSALACLMTPCHPRMPYATVPQGRQGRAHAAEAPA